MKIKVILEWGVAPGEGPSLALPESSGTFVYVMKDIKPKRRRSVPGPILAGGVTLLACILLLVTDGNTQGEPKEQLVPVLGITMEREPTGTVVYVALAFQERDDHTGLMVQFRSAPGRFSRMAQTSIEQAILRVAHSMHLSPDSWSVVLTVPHEGLTIYGESLSAMVGLTVLAMAKGATIAPDRVMTGTVTPDGHIGPVGSVPMKVIAAREAHIRRVLVPAEQDPADGDWRTPFLMHISPVVSVDQAYAALTEPLPSPRVQRLKAADSEQTPEDSGLRLSP